jgi:hypothetical protein
MSARESGQHVMEVTRTGDDQRYRVICPDNGKNCESWQECDQTHPCDCGPHPHDPDCKGHLTEAGCDEDDSLDCDEWLWRDGMMHGEFHQYVGSMVCVEAGGCWMPDWDIEFDQINHEVPPGIYSFTYEEPDPDEGGLLYISEWNRDYRIEKLRLL